MCLYLIGVTKSVDVHQLNQLTEVAQKEGFTIEDVPEDGNCALHAVVDQLILLDDRGTFNVANLRSRAVTRLRDNNLVDDALLNKHRYKNVEDYLTKLSKDGECLDEMMLRAVSECIGREIHILKENGETTLLRPEGLTTQSPINIGQIGERYYVSLLKTD